MNVLAPTHHNVFQTTTRTGLSKYTAHTSHADRIRNRAPCTGHLAASVPTNVTPAAGNLCFTCNPATALIFVLHASGQRPKFVFWLHPGNGSSMGNWNCISVVFWNAGSTTLKAVRS